MDRDVQHTPPPTPNADQEFRPLHSSHAADGSVCAVYRVHSLSKERGLVADDPAGDEAAGRACHVQQRLDAQDVERLQRPLDQQLPQLVRVFGPHLRPLAQQLLGLHRRQAGLWVRGVEGVRK